MRQRNAGDIGDEDVLKASLTFSCHTATQGDGFHPRHFSLLPPLGRKVVVVLFIIVELLGQWPLQTRMLSLFLLAKPSGGWRFIPLCPALHRLWTRVRKYTPANWKDLTPALNLARLQGEPPPTLLGNRASVLKSPCTQGGALLAYSLLGLRSSSISSTKPSRTERKTAPLNPVG